MSQEDLLKLAAKIGNKQASKDEQKIFFKEMTRLLKDFRSDVVSLNKKGSN